MGNVLIVGAGGVGRVVAHKCAQVPEVFEQHHTWPAARFPSVTKLPRRSKRRPAGSIDTAAVDADDVPEMVALDQAGQARLW